MDEIERGVLIAQWAYMRPESSHPADMDPRDLERVIALGDQMMEALAET